MGFISKSSVAVVAFASWLAIAHAPSVSIAADDASKWGTLTATFVFEGEAPPPKAIAGGAAVVNTEFLVIDKNRNLANIVIHAIGDPKNHAAPLKPIHPSYDKLKKDSVVVQMSGGRFDPHVQSMWTEQDLVLKNVDPIVYNIYLMPFENASINVLISPAKQHVARLDRAEKVPVVMSDPIHPWMRHFVVVRPDPYVAVSRLDGTLEIKNLPVGKHVFQIWHESLGYVRKLNVGGKSLNNNRGRHQLAIKPGNNDLGKIVIKSSDYPSQMTKLKELLAK